MRQATIRNSIVTDDWTDRKSARSSSIAEGQCNFKNFPVFWYLTSKQGSYSKQCVWKTEEKSFGKPEATEKLPVKLLVGYGLENIWRWDTKSVSTMTVSDATTERKHSSSHSNGDSENGNSLTEMSKVILLSLTSRHKKNTTRDWAKRPRYFGVIIAVHRGGGLTSMRGWHFPRGAGNILTC